MRKKSPAARSSKGKKEQDAKGSKDQNKEDGKGRERSCQTQEEGKCAKTGGGGKTRKKGFLQKNQKKTSTSHRPSGKKARTNPGTPSRELGGEPAKVNRLCKGDDVGVQSSRGRTKMREGFCGP